MASRFWVGGTGTWDASTTTHWSASSGGAGGASVPTAADDVFFDASSGTGTVTVTFGAPMRSFTGTGSTLAWVFSGQALSLGDAGGGNLTFGAGMTVTGGQIILNGSAGGTITTNGVGGPTMTISGSGTWTHADAWSGGATFTINLGGWNTNGQSVSTGAVSSSNSNTRTVTLGSSSLTLSGTGNAWNLATATNMTFTANTATITLTGASAVLNHGTPVGSTSMNGASVVMSGSGAQAVQGSGIIVANFTRTGTAAKTDSFAPSVNITASGTFTITGNSTTNRMLVQSFTPGTARTFTAAAVSLANTDFQDITGAGAATWTGVSLGDTGGNSGITFDASVQQTRSGAGGNWSDVASWTSRVPLPQDDVVVGAGASGTLTADMPRLGRNVNFTGFTGTFTLSVAVTVYGNWTYASGMTLTGGNAITFSGRSSQTITSAGRTWPQAVVITAPGGTYTLSDAFTDIRTSVYFSVTAGTFSANGFSFTGGGFQSSGTSTRAVSMGSGAWTLNTTAASAVWSTASTGLTLTVSTATVSVTGAPGSAATVTVTTGSVTMPSFTVNGGANLTCQFSDAFTGQTLTLTQATLNTNNQTVSCSILASSNSNTRTLTMGSSAIAITANGTTSLLTGTSAGLVVTANTAVLTMSGSGVTFGGGGINWNGASLVMSGSGTAQAFSGTWANFTRTGTAVKTDALQIAQNFTVTGTFTVTGNSATNRMLVQSSAFGTARTLTVNTTVTVSNADFQDITGAGTASWNLSAATGGSGDALGNTGITFTTAASQFWVSGSGSWSDSTKWKTTSGGAVAGRVPLPQDTAVFDASSFTGASQTVTPDMPRLGKDLTFTGITNSPSLNNPGLNVTVFGSFTGASGLGRGSWSSSLTFAGRSTHTITTAGLAPPSVIFAAVGGTYTLQDAYSVSSQPITHQNGTLNANGQSVTLFSLVSSSGSTRTLTMGSGAWSLAATSSGAWNTSSAGLTLTVTGNTTSFTGTSGAPTITTGGVTMPSVNFNGAGGSWTFSDAFSTAGSITLTSGTWSTGNQTVTAATIVFTGSLARTVTFGSSAISITNAAGVTGFNNLGSTNLTITATTAVVTHTSTSAAASLGTANWNGLSFTFGLATSSITLNSVSATIGNLTVTGTGKTGVLSLNNPAITVTGTFTVTGNSATNRPSIQSSVIGTTRTITAAVTSLTNVDFGDIAAAGAAAWTGTSLGDALGNSGITFDAPTTQTHTASAGGNWSDVTKWTSRVPLPQDAVVVDVNTTGTLTADMPRLGKDLTFTGFTGTLSNASTTTTFFGSLTLGSGMATSGSNTINGRSRSSATITTAAVTVVPLLDLAGPSGTYTFQDAYTSTNNLNASFGTINSNAQSVSVQAVGTSGSAPTINFGGSSTWSITRTTTGNVWAPGSVTVVNGSTSTITIVNASNVSRTFAGNGQTYGTLRYDVASPSQGALVITGANTFASLIVGDGRTLTLPSGSTTTVTSSLSLSGAAYVGYLYLGGQSGQYVSTPDQAALRITGDIDLRAKVALDNWSAPGSSQLLVAKYLGTGNQRSYQFFVEAATGKLHADFSADGVAARTFVSTVAPTVSNGATLWVRVALTSATTTARFYTSPDGVTWTQLGADVVTSTGAAVIFASTAPLEIGSNSGGLNVLSGKLFYADVRNNILDNGTGIVAAFDASLFADPLRYYSPTVNLVDKDSSDLEGSVGGWVAGTGAPTVTRDATLSAEGAASLKIVSAAAGSTVVGVGGSAFNAATAIPVVPGAALSFLATVKGVAVSLVVTWYDGPGGTLSTSTAVASGVAGAFTDVAGTVTAPAAAMWAVPKFSWTAAAAGEVLNADKIAFQVGAAAAGSWSAGAVPWRINGYPNNPGVPFGRTALNASTAGTAANLSAGSAVIVTATYTHLKDSTATGGATFVYGPNGKIIANTTGWYYAAGIGGNPSLRWAVRTRLGDTAQEVWRTAAALGDSSALRWSTRALLADAADVRWGVRTIQGDQAALAWNTRAAAGDAAILRWRTAAALGDSAVLRWAVRATSSDQSALSWAVRIVQADEAALTWATRARLGDAAALTWEARALLADSSALTWEARALLADDAALAWAARSLLAGAAALLWPTRAAQDGTAVLAWPVRATASDQAALRWAVRRAVADAAVLRWKTRLLAGDHAALRWATRTRLSETVALVWDVRSSAVGNAAALLWITRRAAGDDVDVVWRTFYGFLVLRQLIEVLERRQTVDVLDRRQDIAVLGEGITR